MVKTIGFDGTSLAVREAGAEAAEYCMEYNRDVIEANYWDIIKSKDVTIYEPTEAQKQEARDLAYEAMMEYFVGKYPKLQAHRDFCEALVGD